MARIHTLNCRGNVMFAALRNYFSWSDERVFREIQAHHQSCLNILRAKGIRYEELRNALTPQPDRHEAAFLFDEHRCDPDAVAPGVDAADAVFRLLPPNTTHSILGGELIDRKDEIARKLLAQSAVIVKDLNFKHPCFCYVVYVNNLSKSALQALTEGLKSHRGYLAYVPCTYGSLAKTFVGMHLMNLAIRHKNIVILGHEDGEPDTEDRNLHLHDYTTLGLTIRSLQFMYFSTFLSYKPERMLLDATDDDVDFAMRAMSKETASLEDFTVQIEGDKFERYLQTHKRGKLELAGLAHLTKSELEEEIRRKLRSNYLYNIDWRDEPDYQGSFFNIMLEFPREDGYPERTTVALEYKLREKTIRLVTMT